MLVLGQVKATHAQLSKVSRMETVKVSAVMSETSSVTTTSWMLTVLSYSSVTG
jgi:hypothetical protein